MTVLSIYAALFALFYVGLSVRIVGLRRHLKIGLGDAGNRRMLRAIRVHANFGEYVPFSLFLVYLVTAQGASALIIHGLCLTLALGRLSHAWGVSQEPESLKFRVLGMALTFTVLIGAAVTLLARPLLGP